MRTARGSSTKRFTAHLGIAAAAIGLAMSGFLHAQAPAAGVPREPQAADRLPVRRVVLYKSGVGYFEHLGRVRGSQNVTIDFTSGQLDDVLKSLTALDLDGGRVTGVNYNTEAALGRRLGALPLPLGEETTRAQFLTALRGARMEVRTGATRVVGRLLSVERVERKSEAGVTTVDALSLVSDAGEMQTVALDPGVAVRIVEAGLTQEVGRYLSLVSSIREQDLRRLTIATTGTGDRALFVSYVSDVPVWKATYRIVLPAAADTRKPLLQGWAIVDNTVGEDWNGIELSLVAGAPQSFVQAISRPYYTQRPVVPLPERMLLSPQTHQGAMTTTAAPGPPPPPPPPYVPPPPPPPAPAGGGRGGGRGGGAGGQGGAIAGLAQDRNSLNISIDGVSAAGANATAFRRAEIVGRSDAVEAVMLAQQADATGSQLGDLFEYKLREPVTIRKNQSALVPILAGDVDAQKVSLWNAASGASRPLRAIWLTNTTGLTLDGGTFSIVEGQAFAGEGLMDPLRAGEKRLLSYAVDLGVQISAKGDAVPTRATRVSISRGLIVQRSEERQQRTYTVRNEDTEARVLIIEHPARAGWTLAETAKPAETTAAWHRFRVPVEPKATATLVVEETRAIDTQVALRALTDDHLALFVRDRALTPELEATLRQVLSRKAEIARLGNEIATREGEMATIGQDQLRLRENMKALSGSSDERQLRQRYVRQLDEQENRLEALRREAQALTAQRAQAQAELAQFIDGLSG